MHFFLSPVNEKGRKENKKMITVIYSPSVTENKKQKQDKNIRKWNLLSMRVFALFFSQFSICLFACSSSFSFFLDFLFSSFPCMYVFV